jgi:hypothetical protein
MHQMNARAHHMGEPKHARERRHLTHDPRKVVLVHRDIMRIELRKAKMTAAAG